MGVEILFPLVSRCTAPLKSVNIDDVSSQLNRTFMFYLSLTFAVTITIRQQLGGPVIACDGFDVDRERFAEDWCWSQGLYTIKEAYEMKNRVSPYPGIIPEDLPACVEFELYSGGKIECPNEWEVKPFTRIYQSWYPFAMFYFWLIALMFFIPYSIFRLFGFEKVKAVVAMLQNPVEDGFEKKELIKRGSIWLYLQSSMCLSNESLYSFFIVKHSLAFTALFVKGLYIGNIVLIYVMTHKMFKFGSFMEYGLLWEMNTPIGNVKSLIQEKLFPKVAACELKRFGTSGLEEEQGMCMLALNILNQYIFLIFWFCLVIMFLVNCLSFLWTLLRIISPTVMLRSFLLTSGLDKSPALPIISKLYLNSGSSLRFIIEIFASNVQPNLVGEILVQCYVLLADDMSRELHPIRPTEPPRVSALHKVLDGIKTTKLTRRNSEGATRNNGSKSENVNEEIESHHVTGKRECEETVPETPAENQIPIVMLNGEILSLRSEASGADTPRTSVGVRAVCPPRTLR